MVCSGYFLGASNRHVQAHESTGWSENNGGNQEGDQLWCPAAGQLLWQDTGQNKASDQQDPYHQDSANCYVYLKNHLNTWSSWRFCSTVGIVHPLSCSTFNHLVCCVVYCQVLEISAVEMSAGARWLSACGAQSSEKNRLKYSFQKSWPSYLKIIRTCCEQFDGGTFFFLSALLSHPSAVSASRRIQPCVDVRFSLCSDPVSRCSSVERK